MAKSFTDTAGRTWTVNITANAAKNVRDTLGLDLLKATGSSLIRDLGSDPVKIVDILYVLIEPQAKELGISDQQFGAGIAGDVLGEALSVFFCALMDFLPPRQRRILRLAIDDANDLQEREYATIQKRAARPNRR